MKGSRILAGVVGGLAMASAIAESRAPLTTGPDLPFPGIGQILMGLVLAIGLAVLAAWLLGPWLRRWGTRTTGTRQLQVTGRVELERGLTLHLVEVANQVVVVTHSRSGVSTTVLPAATTRTGPEPGSERAL